MKARSIVGLLVVSLAACGPNAAIVQRARTAGYQTDVGNVWKAVAEEMHQRFPDKIKVEDKDKGLIVSDWRELHVDQESTSQGGRESSQRTYLRMKVQIVGPGAPWHLAVDAEAA